MVVIALFALLVFGPSKLPEIARTIKRGLQEWNKVKGQVDETITELKSEIDIKAQIEDELKPAFTPAKRVSARKPISAKQEGLLPDDQVQPPAILDVPEQDDYLKPSVDDLYPQPEEADEMGDDYLGAEK